MPTLVTCPCGHSWSLIAPASGARRPLTCPVCGDVVRPADAAGGSPPSETETIAPAAPVDAEAVTIAPAGELSAPATGPSAAIPGYEIIRELGRGGMGVVYQARHLKLNRLVALKMILAGSHAGAADLARFQTEAEAIARLRHANIVQVYEVGEHEGKPFFSLEFCGGGSLEKKLNGTPLPAREAAALARGGGAAGDAGGGDASCA